MADDFDMDVGDEEDEDDDEDCVEEYEDENVKN